MLMLKFLEGLMSRSPEWTVLACSHRHTPLEAKRRGPTHKQAKKTNKHAAAHGKVSTVAPCAKLEKRYRFFL